jgi:hypothetical protein
MQQRPQHPLLHRVQQPSRRLYLYVANSTTSVLLAHPYVERRRLATATSPGHKKPRTENRTERTENRNRKNRNRENRFLFGSRMLRTEYPGSFRRLTEEPSKQPIDTLSGPTFQKSTNNIQTLALPRPPTADAQSPDPSRAACSPLAALRRSSPLRPP